jgi:hypothetical protein
MQASTRKEDLMLAVVSKEEALAKLQSARRTLSSIRERAEAGTAKAICGVEVLAGAAAVSWYNGKNGQSGAAAQFMGYDADLAAGVVLGAAGMFELAGKQSDHLFYLGVGALAAYTTREAYAKGTLAASK